MRPGSMSGRLLVASPDLGDPLFARTVVFLLAHNSEGAMGLVLNRPSEASVSEILPAWAPLTVAPGQVFLGGPLSPDTVIGLARAPARTTGRTPPFDPLLGTVGAVDLNRDPGDLGVSEDSARLFAGNAGWRAGQLEDELGEGAWFVVDGEPDDLLTTDPDDLWRKVMRRQPGRLAWLANAAGDPRYN